jgi:hypothetical protein
VHCTAQPDRDDNGSTYTGMKAFFGGNDEPNNIVVALLIRRDA